MGDLISSSISGYGTLFGDRDGDVLVDEEEGRWRGVWKRWVGDVWITPTSVGVKGVVERWWWRWWVLVGLPAGLVSFIFSKGMGVGVCQSYGDLADRFWFGLGSNMVRHPVSTISPRKRR